MSTISVFHTSSKNVKFFIDNPKLFGGCAKKFGGRDNNFVGHLRFFMDQLFFGVLSHKTFLHYVVPAMIIKNLLTPQNVEKSVAQGWA